MKFLPKDILRIVSCGCWYIGIDARDCFGCPFEEARNRLGISCDEFTVHPDVVLKVASEAYSTNKKFARVFDKLCGKYMYNLPVKAVIL